MSAFILLLTVVGVLTVGIIAAYGTISAILFTLAPRTAPEMQSAPAIVTPQAQAASAGGD